MMVNVRNTDTKHQESETISINSIYLSSCTRLIQFKKLTLFPHFDNYRFTIFCNLNLNAEVSWYSIYKFSLNLYPFQTHLCLNIMCII